MNLRTRSGGFSLIEIIVVLGIIIGLTTLTAAGIQLWFFGGAYKAELLRKDLSLLQQHIILFSERDGLLINLPKSGAGPTDWPSGSPPTGWPTENSPDPNNPGKIKRSDIQSKLMLFKLVQNFALPARFYCLPPATTTASIPNVPPPFDCDDLPPNPLNGYYTLDPIIYPFHILLFLTIPVPQEPPALPNNASDPEYDKTKKQRNAYASRIQKISIILNRATSTLSSTVLHCISRPSNNEIDIYLRIAISSDYLPSPSEKPFKPHVKAECDPTEFSTYIAGFIS